MSGDSSAGRARLTRPLQPLKGFVEAVHDSNLNVGGNVLESNGAWHKTSASFAALPNMLPSEGVAQDRTAGSPVLLENLEPARGLEPRTC
jgi:hypothetical protein